MKAVDINRIDNEEGIKRLKKMGWFGAIYTQYHDEFDEEKLNKVIELGEQYGLKIYSGIKIRTQSSKELRNLVRKYRNRFHLVLVEGGVEKVNRSALEMHDVDILSTPELNRKDSGIDHVLARLASVHRVAIELNFNEALTAKNYERARILMAFRRNLKLAKKFDAPVVISSDANDIYTIKSPYDLRAFLNTLVEPEYAKKIIETTYKIAEYRAYLKKKNVVRFGVEIVEDDEV
ncbi:ribonuclease P protein component 3 [Methanotorris igneus]|uniref:Ribonuclease P protein component 3 n=1 Tax=Methanotorris igneus (strain DSM 5666 / JCM 11834 / Kol 5) TaxID=880724 RepID=F6BBB2_METIK|nr:RNase P subunit p30 family protein [Methanotorris igneus]AEF97119.1 Ribonuclease P protein component 3 [Methanotorris igneus Kol 5]